MDRDRARSRGARRRAAPEARLTTRALAVAGVVLGAVLALPGVAAANGIHSGGGEGPNVPLLVAGGVVLAASIAALVIRRGPRWLAAGGLVVAAVLGTLGLTTGGKGRPATDATVAIVEPESGAQVPAREPVTVAVEVRNGAVATSPTDTQGGHLHLYVDGALQQMPYSTEIEVELAPGPHNVTVEYVDHQHVSFDPPVQTSISVTARERG